MNDEAGIYDDLIITKIEKGFLIILNAACKDNDFIITMLTEKIDGKKVIIDKLVNHFTKKRIPDKYVFDRRNRYYNE